MRRLFVLIVMIFAMATLVLMTGCGALAPAKTATEDEFANPPDALPKDMVDALINDSKTAEIAQDAPAVELALDIYTGVGAHESDSVEGIVIVFAAVGVDEGGAIRAMMFNGAACVFTESDEEGGQPTLTFAPWDAGLADTIKRLSAFATLDEATAYCDGAIQGNETNNAVIALKNAIDNAVLSPITTSAEIILSLGVSSNAAWSGEGGYTLSAAACALSATAADDGGTIMAADFIKVTKDYTANETTTAFVFGADESGDMLVGGTIEGLSAIAEDLPNDYAAALGCAAEIFTGVR